MCQFLGFVSTYVEGKGVEVWACDLVHHTKCEEMYGDLSGCTGLKDVTLPEGLKTAYLSGCPEGCHPARGAGIRRPEWLHRPEGCHPARGAEDRRPEWLHRPEGCPKETTTMPILLCVVPPDVSHSARKDNAT